MVQSDEEPDTNAQNPTNGIFHEAQNSDENQPLLSEQITEISNEETNNQTPKCLRMRFKILLFFFAFLVTFLAVWKVLFLRNLENKIYGCPISSMYTDDFDNVFDNLAKDIKNSNFSEIHDILSKCECSYGSSLFITDLVQAAYNGNLNNFTVVLKFLRNKMIPAWEQYRGFSALQATMHKCNHDHTSEMIKLVYFIKTAMQNSEVENSLELHRKYIELTQLVPTNIRLMIFNQCLSIENNINKEILFLSTVTAISQRLVMTSTKELKELCKFPNAFWYLEGDYENDNIVFRVRNQDNHYNSAICHSPEYFDMQRGNTVECSKDTKPNAIWVVTPVNNHTYFTIKSEDGHFLYSPDDTYLYDTNRRYTFPTLEPWENVLDHPSALWNISGCPTCENINNIK